MNAIQPSVLFGFGAPGIQELIVILLILALNGIWIWALVHCCRNPRLSNDTRVVGIILIAVLNILGALIYLCLPREKIEAVETTPDDSANLS